MKADSTMCIRFATEDDCNAISQLIKENAEAILCGHYPRGHIEVWKEYNSPDLLRSRLSDGMMFCAYNETQITGTASLRGAELAGLYVHPEFIGRGIGGQLLAYVESVAKEQGIERLHLASTPAAVEFYRRHGWRELDKVVLTIMGVDFEDTAMDKVLNSASIR